MKKYILIVLVSLTGASQIKAGDWSGWAVPAGIGAAGVAAGAAAKSYLNSGDKCKMRVAVLESNIEVCNQYVAVYKNMIKVLNKRIQNLGEAMLDQEVRRNFVGAMDKAEQKSPLSRVDQIYEANQDAIEEGLNRVYAERGLKRS